MSLQGENKDCTELCCGTGNQINKQDFFQQLVRLFETKKPKTTQDLRPKILWDLEIEDS